jgi:hypothetical protein
MAMELIATAERTVMFFLHASTFAPVCRSPASIPLVLIVFLCYRPCLFHLGNSHRREGPQQQPTEERPMRCVRCRVRRQATQEDRGASKDR